MRISAQNALLYATFITASLTTATSSANAHSHHGHGHAHAASHHTHSRLRHIAYMHRVRYGAPVIQCVAFAKADAGIEIRGNARDWWNRAAGIYERGSQPEPGSVLSFRETGRMPLGHVAVVSATLDERTIVIDQSHWNSRGITRDIEVKDVSEDNDWSLVRVQLGHGREFGSIYPTHGFIYPRPATARPAPEEEVQPATTFKPSTLQHYHSTLEVAEAPMNGRPLDLSINGIATDAPYRAWR